MFQNSRRNFLKTASVGTMAAISIPQIVSAVVGNMPAKKVMISKDDVILFQGDSITDWGRDHNAKEPNMTNTLGTGYALLTAAELMMKHPDKTLKFYNKGKGGNKVYQLAERWDTDALDLKPNILSIH
ncbi:MAG: twin-arginine translocation signal domain-containing protein, partial [Sphingobacteriaceae bacterium]